MKIVNLKNLNEIEKVTKVIKNENLIIDLSECADKYERLRIIDFLAGLLYYNGKMKKQSENRFLIEYN